MFEPDTQSELAIRLLLYSVADVCRATHLGRTTVFGLLATGELESVRVGARRLVPADALEDFVARLRGDAGRSSATAEEGQ